MSTILFVTVTIRSTSAQSRPQGGVFSSIARAVPSPNPNLTNPKLFPFTSLLGIIGVCTFALLSEGHLPEYDTRVLRSEIIEGRGEDGQDDDGEFSITLSRW